MKWWLFIGILTISILNGQNPADIYSTTWSVNSLDSLAGFPVILSGTPKLIDSDEYGSVVWFDGIDDGFHVESNPLEGATNFTIEVIFRPDSSWPANQEQRFFHIQNPANDNRRILIELRLTDNHEWYLDTYIKSELSSKALKLETALHQVGKWYHAALVYENRSMKHFVDGIEEVSGEVDFLPVSNGHTSIGTRMDQRSWFKGSVALIKLTDSALTPDNFIINVSSITDSPVLKKEYRLEQNYPNPFNSSTHIHFNLTQRNYVNLSIYNSLGQKIITILDKDLAKGLYNYTWSGMDAMGNAVTTGVYFIRLQVGSEITAKKVLCLK